MKHKNNDELFKLYQSLTIEQCIELYKQQKANLNPHDSTAVLAIIGAKTVYGKDYVPGYKGLMKKLNAEKQENKQVQ